MVKLVALVVLIPGSVVTPMRPLVAPAGTTAVTEVAELTVKLAAGRPLKVTCVVPARLVPVSVMLLPMGPLAGLKLVTVGVAPFRYTPMLPVSESPEPLTRSRVPSLFTSASAT
jgi:hypothetical protein